MIILAPSLYELVDAGGSLYIYRISIGTMTRWGRGDPLMEAHGSCELSLSLIDLGFF